MGQLTWAILLIGAGILCVYLGFKGGGFGGGIFSWL